MPDTKDLPRNKALVTAVFEAIIAGENDLTPEEQQDLCAALNAVVARWRARPRVPAGPDVSGYWLQGATNAKTAVQ
jgi:hypothetical protein